MSGICTKELVLVRHGESEYNVANRASRRGDHSLLTTRLKHANSGNFRLSPLGRTQAAQAGNWLKKEFGSFDYYATSPYIRAIETAGLLGFPHARWEKNKYFIERSYGDLELKPQTDPRNVRAALGRNEREGKTDLLFWRPPGGENFVELCVRVCVGFQKIFMQNPHARKILIVCHGEVMYAAHMIFGSMSDEECVRRQISKNGNEKIWNCEILHYAGFFRRDCAAAGLSFSRFRTIRPTAHPADASAWMHIRPEYASSEDLLREAERHPRLL